MKNNINSIKLAQNQCKKLIDWILQISLWIILFFLILLTQISNSSTISTTFGILFLLIDIAYIINNIFFSKIFKFIFHIEESDNITNALDRIFNEHPNLSFEINCFHFNNPKVIDINQELENNVKKSNQNSNVSSKIFNSELNNKKIKTYNDTNKFYYYNCKDVSGEIIIENKINKNYYYFVNLNLKIEIIFADSISFYDYETQKNTFLNKNKWRDVHTEIFEKKYIKNSFNTSFLKINNAEIPIIFNWKFYIFFVFICAAEIYKIFFLNHVIEKSFLVKKLISSRNKINEEDYYELNPKIIINNENTIENKNYFYQNEKVKIKPIQEKELEEAKNYEKYILTVQQIKEMENNLKNFDYNYNNININDEKMQDNIDIYNDDLINKDNNINNTKNDMLEKLV